MNQIQQLISKVNEQGMQLEPRPGGLFVHHRRGQLSPDLERELRTHKAELLAWLSAEHLIKQVLAGEFDGADGATVSNLARIIKRSGHRLAGAEIEKIFLSQFN
jgi:hypothetical protein